MTSKTRIGWFFLALSLLLLPSAPALAQEASVSAVDNEFDPAQIDVEAGTTITWTNNGDSPHTVTASDGSFDSDNLDPGQTFSYTFDQAGDFSYVCEYHEGSGMVGAVTVAEADGDGNGNGGGGNGDGTTDDPTDPADDTNDETLPQTGPEGLGGLLFLAAALIGAGSTLIWLDRETYRSWASSATQSRVK